MKPVLFTGLILGGAAFVSADESATQMSEVVVYSPRVANQGPAATFAMPVSALRYEPQVDLQARNIVEGQADVTIRGGGFENTGLRLGALTIGDAQTGHYLAEIPIAPAMLGAPEILTGASLTSVTGATAGALQYAWRPIRTGGSIQLGAGPHDLGRAEWYQGYLSDVTLAGGKIGADVALAHSESDGPIAFGDHRFDRLNARFQRITHDSQTDLFAGYQAKFFGWPNLYTPFNSKESENLQTLLFSLNHRVDYGAGEFFTAGAYHRRNKDDYAYNRFAPLGTTHPYQHTTWEDGIAAEARRGVGDFFLNLRAEALTDFLASTSLTSGNYRSRSQVKVAAIPERTWTLAPGESLIAKAGVTYDDSNRDHGTFSPVAEVAREFSQGVVRRVYVSYSRTTQEPSYTALRSSATSGLFRGNPNLGRETARNAEVGVSGLLMGWTGQAAVFARRDDALVDWTFKRGVTARTANAVDVDTVGFETFARRSWKAVDLVLGYTLLTKDPDYRGADVDASFYALNYARQRLTAAVTVRLGHGFELRMDNVARVQASNLLRTEAGDRAVFSTLALAYRPAFWRGVELTAQMDNLWNSHFQEVPSVPASPRQWSVGASYVW